MESVDLEMGDIFDVGGAAEDIDDFELPPPLPDLDTEQVLVERAGDEAEEAPDGAQQTRDMSKGAAKKRVMRPQPKLNAERLKAERGLSQLPSLFENTQFKGVGHETEDLKLMMTQLEHWAHRLFPKIPFDDFIARLEKLGQSKPVQTCLKRIRLDMSIGDEDLVIQNNDDDDDDRPTANENTQSPANQDDEDTPTNAEDAFDAMLRKDGQPAPSDGEQNQFVSVTEAAASKPTSLTTEQLERIRRNREMALQKRRHTVTAPSSDTTPSQCTHINEPASDHATDDNDITNETTDNNETIASNNGVQRTHDEMLASLDSDDADDEQVTPPAGDITQPTDDAPLDSEIAI